MENWYKQLDATNALQEGTRSFMMELGERFSEIAELQRVSGIGVAGSHVFDALVQTLHRLTNKRCLWKYFGLGIRQCSCARRPSAFRRLDRS